MPKQVNQPELAFLSWPRLCTWNKTLSQPAVKLPNIYSLNSGNKSNKAKKLQSP